MLLCHNIGVTDSDFVHLLYKNIIAGMVVDKAQFFLHSLIFCIVLFKRRIYIIIRQVVCGIFFSILGIVDMCT